MGLPSHAMAERYSVGRDQLVALLVAPTTIQHATG